MKGAHKLWLSILLAILVRLIWMYVSYVYANFEGREERFELIGVPIIVLYGLWAFCTYAEIIEYDRDKLRWWHYFNIFYLMFLLLDVIVSGIVGLINYINKQANKYL